MPPNVPSCSLPVSAPSHDYGVASLKAYGESRLKLTAQKSVCRSGFDRPYTEKNTVNSEKLDSNICRARAQVREYGLCNDWEYFVTLTLRPDGRDRYDLKAYRRQLSQWLRDMRKQTGADLHFLLVPEKHQSGAWHMHGLFASLPSDSLVLFDSRQHLPHHILDKLGRGQTVYNWPAYAEKFGFCEVEPLRNRDKAVSYITKYITKDLACSVSQMGAHLFYASKGLNRAETLKRGHLQQPLDFAFENDYCGVNWYNTQDANISFLLSAIGN